MSLDFHSRPLVFRLLTAFGAAALLLIIGLAGLGRAPTFAAAGSPNHCFWRHVEEARILNQTRLRYYAAASSGKSVRISLTMMASEVMLEPLAVWFDYRASLIGPSAVNLLCKGLVAMTTVPPANRPIPTPGTFVPQTARRAQKKIAIMLRRDLRDLASVRETLASALGDLDDAPGYYCMQRHIAESAQRFVGLGLTQLDGLKTYREKAELESFLIHLLRLHLEPGVGAVWLDRLAEPLQSAGTPIVCNDVPKIPEWDDDDPSS